jgi:hypothetical protein
MARLLQQGPWTYFYYREGDHDLGFPPIFSCDPPASAMEIGVGRKNPR